CVDGVEAALAGGGVELAGDLGGRGSVIDEDRAFGNAVEGAVRPQRDLAQVVVVADAGHDEVLALGGGARRRRGTPAALRHPLLGLGGGAIVDRDLVTALDLEVTGHRVAHHAEPEKRNLCHEDPPTAYRRLRRSLAPSFLSHSTAPHLTLPSPSRLGCDRACPRYLDEHATGRR